MPGKRTSVDALRDQALGAPAPAGNGSLTIPAEKAPDGAGPLASGHRARFAFLAETGRSLAAAPDPGTTPATVARSLPPGPGCMAYTAEAGLTIGRVAILPTGPAKQRLAESFYRTQPPGRDVLARELGGRCGTARENARLSAGLQDVLPAAEAAREAATFGALRADELPDAAHGPSITVRVPRLADRSAAHGWTRWRRSPRAPGSGSWRAGARPRRGAKAGPSVAPT